MYRWLPESGLTLSAELRKARGQRLASEQLQGLVRAAIGPRPRGVVARRRRPGVS